MRIALTTLLPIILFGCGTYTPKMSYVQEDQLYEIDVKRSIDCAIIDATHEAFQQATVLTNLRNKRVDFFHNWGLEYQYTLKMVEDSSVNPNLDLLFPTTPVNMLLPGDFVFTLNSGMHFSAKATKTVKNTDFDPLDIWNSKAPCIDSASRNKISIARDDLGITGWLTSRLAMVDSDSVTTVTEKSAFTLQFDFEIGRRLNTNPTWSFVRREISKTNGLFNMGRTRTHSLLITLGPADDTRIGLARKAADQQLAAQIAAGISRQ